MPFPRSRLVPGLLALVTAAVTAALLAACAGPGAVPPAPEARVAALLAGMTLEQKVGQMTQAEIQHATPDDVRRYHLGSVLNGGGSWPGSACQVPLNAGDANHAPLFALGHGLGVNGRNTVPVLDESLPRGGCGGAEEVAILRQSVQRPFSLHLRGLGDKPWRGPDPSADPLALTEAPARHLANPPAVRVSTAEMHAQPDAKPRTLKVPVACFAARGLDMGRVDVPFSIATSGPFEAAFARIRIVAGAARDADALRCNELPVAPIP